MSSKTLTFNTSIIFLNSTSSLHTQTLPPLSPLPTNFPQSKIIPNSRFIVDGFRFAGDFSVSYFLSHFHSDHYTGLSPNWSNGVIYCSQITASLLIEVLRVPEKFVVSLPVSETVVVDDCEVTLINANHCPGAVQFLFKVGVSEGECKRYVHTGDFRYCDSMKLEPVLSEFVGADVVYLDTTYCNPKFVFPVQDESIDYIVEVINRIGVENVRKSKSVLFLVATYVIGKEKILLEISRRCNRKIHVDKRKMDILHVLGFGDDGVFTEDESESDVHVVGWKVLGETWPYFRPNFVMMKEIINAKGYDKVVGVVPTGWTYEVKRNKFAVRTKDSFEIHLVPYSEHSNYEELREYVKFLKPKRVIPTVGVDVEKLDSKHAHAMQKHFAGLVDEMAIKQDFLMSFHKGIRNSTDKPASCDTVTDEEKGLACAGAQALKDTVPEMVVSSLQDQVPVPQNVVLVNDNNITEEMLQELRDCLPAWVTRDQMLDLLQSCNRDIVEAVSNFYEHEIEFHEQAVASKSAGFTSQPGFESDSSLPLAPDVEVHAIRNDKSPFNVSFKSLGTKPAIKHGISPAKKRRNVKNTPNKRARTDSGKEIIEPKQHTITKFFSKLTPSAPESGKLEYVCEKSDKEEKVFQTDCTWPYKDELEQFMQIANCGASLRSYATNLINETKGDIDKALDMYYSDCDCKLNENKEKLSESSKPCTTEQHIGSSASVQVRRVPGNMLKENNVSAICKPTDKSTSDAVSLVPDKDKVHTSSQENSTNDVATCFVSLPPHDYSPINHACWKGGQPAPYIHLARTFDLVKEVKGKIKATLMLCNMFRSLLALSPEDVLPAVYLCTNKIAPDHENMELNIGESIIVSALEETCGTNRSKIRGLYKNLGDLGDVAQLCRQTQSLLAAPAPLSIQGVFSALRKISEQTGSGSTRRKKDLIMNLMRSCREKEMKYLVRTLVRNLRIGAMMRTVLPALAQAVAMSSAPAEGITENTKVQLQELSAVVVEAYNVLPNLNLLIPSLLDNGIRFSSTTLSMVPGIPIKPMLAKITNGTSQVLKLFSCKAFTCEYKYDGQRAQIHKLSDGSLRVFSRNGDETTSRFPDLVNIIKESCSSEAETFVLDAEVVAVDRKNGCKLMSFQELSSRDRGGKDSSITVDSIKVDICVFAFDIMFANGEQLLSTPLRQRRTFLKNFFGNEKAGYFEYAREITVEADDALMTSKGTVDKINCFLDKAVHSSCEGIMVKCLDIEAGYTPSKRSDTWLKVKRDYLEGLNDSLDLVPIGAWSGNGRKAGWYSPFLVACYDPDLEEFQSVCRVMSGFSDSFYIEMKEFYLGDKILSKKPPYYQTAEQPDMWFSPELSSPARNLEFFDALGHHPRTQVLSSSWVPYRSGYAVGALIGNKLYLNPMHAAAQFRPSMQHFGSEQLGKKKILSHDGGAPAEEKSFGPSKNQKKQAGNANEALTDSVKEWIHLKYHSSNSNVSDKYLHKMVAEEGSEIEFAMSSSDYIDSLCPGLTNRLGGPSKRYLLSLPLEDRLKTYLCKVAPVHRFNVLKYLAPSDSVEDLLEVLKKLCYLVQGLWVPKSSLLKLQGLDALVRDYTLYLFSKSHCISKNDLPLKSKFKKAMEDVLKVFSVHRPALSDWKFKEPTDMSFVQLYPDIVEEQEQAWETRGVKLNTQICGERSGNGINNPSKMDAKKGVPKNSSKTPAKKSISDETREALIKALQKLFQSNKICSFQRICKLLRDMAISKDVHAKGGALEKFAATGLDAPPEELLAIFNQVAIDIHGVFVSKTSTEHSYDGLRRTVIDLLIAEGPNAKLKKAAILEAAKIRLKREDIPVTEYSKVMSELCVSRNSVWVLKSGDGSPDDKLS